jgi:thioredoxin reductase (NADPH)
VEGVFIAIGHTPNTGLFRGKLEMDPNGYLITHDGTRTSIPGVFAAGDVRAGSVKRVAAAVGEGATAIQLVHGYLSAAGTANTPSGS